MALLTVDQLREHIETDVTDAAMQRYLDAADFDLTDRYGSHVGTLIEYFTGAGADCLVFTTRKIDTITEIVETSRGIDGDLETTLAGDDYIAEGSRQIRRLSNGTNGASYWAPRVKVSYTPLGDTAKRIGTTIDLVRLAVRYEAASSVKLGDVSVNHVDYNLERERILARLQPTVMGYWA